MDFATVGLDGLVSATTSSFSLDPEAKQRQYSSGIFKTDRSSVSDEEWRSSKLAKTDDFSVSKLMQRGIIDPSMIRSSSSRSSSSSFFSAAARQEQQQMLCFSSPKTEHTLPYYNYPVSSASAPCSNYSGWSLNLQGGGGFTAAQWMELEQQALIYKYINANIPVPSNLLIPIKKAFESAGFSFYHGTKPNNNSLGWGGFHLGFSGSSDPEPGRCRRTDGKKWRCSKDAMPEQKYCERHMNRGRHRSRKPVEGQSAHPVSGTAAAAKESSASLLPPVASVAPGGGLSTAAYQIQPAVLSLSADNTVDSRFFISTEKPQNTAPTFSNYIKSKDNLFPMIKHDNESSTCRFGSDISSNTFFGNLGTLKELTGRETSHPHHRFANDWAPPQSHASNEEKLAFLPLNLGMGSIDEEEQDPKWGPLGEVLQNANSSTSSSTTTDHCKNSSGSGLNLMMMDGWERSSPAGSYSSPTAVLQKSAFESVSNSSAGSSPRAA